MAPDLVTYKTIRSGSPHGLQVTKNRDIVAASQWLVRQREARAFLGTIGSDAVIAKIMDDRYGDIVNALDGTQQFRLSTASNSAPQAGPSGSSSLAPAPGPAATSAPAPSAPLPSAPLNISTGVGQKRKKTPRVDGDVVDLTGNSP
jgi:hypothetical protein